jgi:hypothetical protein
MMEFRWGRRVTYDNFVAWLAKWRPGAGLNDITISNLNAVRCASRCSFVDDSVGDLHNGRGAHPRLADWRPGAGLNDFTLTRVNTRRCSSGSSCVDDSVGDTFDGRGLLLTALKNSGIGGVRCGANDGRCDAGNREEDSLELHCVVRVQLACDGVSFVGGVEERRSKEIGRTYIHRPSIPVLIKARLLRDHWGVKPRMQS